MTLTVDDRLQMIQLLGSYNQTLDRRDSRAWADIFTEDGVYHKKGDAEVRGQGALTTLVDSLGPDSLARHWAGNFIFEEQGDKVRLLADMAVLKGNKVLTTGRAVNTMRRVAAGWKLSHQQLSENP